MIAKQEPLVLCQVKSLDGKIAGLTQITFLAPISVGLAYLHIALFRHFTLKVQSWHISGNAFYIRAISSLPSTMTLIADYRRKSSLQEAECSRRMRAESLMHVLWEAQWYFKDQTLLRIVMTL